MSARKVFIALVLFTASVSSWAQDSYPVVEVKISNDKVKVKGNIYFTHVVQEKQTLYSIAKAYKVSTLDIIDSNPKLHLDERMIHPGDVLMVPVTRANDTSENSIRDVQEEVAPVTDIAIVENKPAGSHDMIATAPARIDSTAKVTVSLLLPFEADTTASVNYLNFYFGSLIAVKEIGERGAQITLNVIDIAQNGALEDNERELRKSDIIIGPVRTSDISRTLNILPRDKYIISPLDAGTEVLARNNRVILAATTSRHQIEDAVEWIREDRIGGTDSLVVVRETDCKMTPTEDIIVSELNPESTPRTVELNYAIKDYAKKDRDGRIGSFNPLDAHTHYKDTITRIIAASEHDIFIKDVIRNAYLQNNVHKNAVLYGTAKTKTEDMKEMCDANLHSSVTYYVDYDNPDVIRFVKDYRALYGAEPNNFSFHGYDTMKYFVTMYCIYGDMWAENLEEVEMSGLQIHFKFKCPEGWEGAVNQGLRRLVYSADYNVEVRDR